jgi:hypothetical protein
MRPKRENAPGQSASPNWRTPKAGAPSSGTLCREASWNAVVATRPDNAASARKRTGQSGKWKARPAGFSGQNVGIKTNSVCVLPEC